jgi:hypothetical protein
MVRYSRRNRRGGDKLDDIQVQVDSIQQQLNELKGSSSSMPEMPEPEQAIPEIETVKVIKTWVDDKNKKFRDGAGGRVSLSFNRIMSLLDNNIKKGDAKKDWSSIKQKLTDANSVGDVQDVIDEYKVSFASNYVAGTRRRKGRGKKRTHRRR